MKKVIVTQRFEKIGKHRELRDNLDIRLCNLIERSNKLIKISIK